MRLILFFSTKGSEDFAPSVQVLSDLRGDEREATLAIPLNARPVRRRVQPLTIAIAVGVEQARTASGYCLSRTRP